MRLILLLLFACVALWLGGVGEARAECVPMSSPRWANCADEGEAYAWVASHVPVHSGPSTGCSIDKWTNITQTRLDASSWGTTYSHPNGCGYPLDGLLWSYAQWPAGVDCDDRSSQTGWALPDEDPATPDTVCHDGCAYEPTLLIPEGTRQWNPTGAVCSLSDTPEARPDRDDDGTPDDDDWAPDDPTEDKDSDNDGVGDNADTSDNDPSNGNDGGDQGSPGDEPGTGPGDETDNRAEGGGTCDAPPFCSGDGIQCNQLYQMWKTRCAAEQTAANTGEGGAGDGDGPGTVSGGACNASYVCTGGDPVACAALNEQHKLRCGLLGDGSQGELNYGADGDPATLYGSVNPLDGFSFNDDGWLGGSSCPIDSLAVGSDSVDMSPLCNGASVLAFYVLMLGFIHGMWIVGQSVARAG